MTKKKGAVRTPVQRLGEWGACWGSIETVRKQGFWEAWRTTQRGDWLITLLSNLASRSPEAARWIIRGLRREAWAVVRVADLDPVERKLLRGLARLPAPPDAYPSVVTILQNRGVSGDLIDIIQYSGPASAKRKNAARHIMWWRNAWFGMDDKGYGAARRLAERLREMFPERQLARHLRRIGWALPEAERLAGSSEKENG